MEFGRQAINRLMAGMVGRRYMIYMGPYEVGDIWANRWCGSVSVGQVSRGALVRNSALPPWLWGPKHAHYVLYRIIVGG